MEDIGRMRNHPNESGVMFDDSREASAGQAAKRQRLGSSRVPMSYPRKRAVTACRLCRVRKTKCNNIRPKCGSCQDSGATCIYEDNLDHSSFDPASLVIIDRINHVIERLEYFEQSSTIREPPTTLPYKTQTIAPQPLTPSNVDQDQHSPTVAFANSHSSDQDDFGDEYMLIPSSRTAPDTVLCWPVFEGRYPRNFLVETLFEVGGDSDVENNSLPSETFQDSTQRRYQGIEDNDLQGLVENFITNVHTKNPILDIETLLNYTRTVQEEGFAWDGISCLVLLTCALGCIARPYNKSSADVVFMEADDVSIESCQSQRRQSLHYFVLARKRIGLLKTSILKSQCYFWSGVYLMYLLQPVEAWQSFVQASNSHHMYLKGCLGQGANKGVPAKKTRQLEQRLYWSCFKSECELRAELALPESSISAVRYPDLFPSPPNTGSPAITEKGQLGTADEYNSPTQSLNLSPISQTLSFNEAQQQSWYYYLTEISLRRIGNRVMNTFYRDELSVNMPILSMIKYAEDFEVQCLQWSTGLPAALQFNDYRLEVAELPHMLGFRFLEIKFLVYLPFLFYAIHHKPDDPSRAYIQHLVDKALHCTLAMTPTLLRKHRHHGSWISVRSSLGAAFILVAARESGNVEIPIDWLDSLQILIAEMKYWEQESPDIRRGRSVLENMLKEVTSQPQR